MQQLIEKIEQEAISYERGKMLRDDSEVEIDLFDDEIWLCDYSETRGSGEGIKKLCNVNEVDLKEIKEMCGRHNWYMVGI